MAALKVMSCEIAILLPFFHDYNLRLVLFIRLCATYFEFDGSTAFEIIPREGIMGLRNDLFMRFIFMYLLLMTHHPHMNFYFSV